jgi:hypothetical protein
MWQPYPTLAYSFVKTPQKIVVVIPAGTVVQLYLIPWARKIGSMAWPQHESKKKRDKAE